MKSLVGLWETVSPRQHSLLWRISCQLFRMQTDAKYTFIYGVIFGLVVWWRLLSSPNDMQLPIHLESIVIFSLTRFGPIHFLPNYLHGPSKNSKPIVFSRFQARSGWWNRSATDFLVLFR